MLKIRLKRTGRKKKPFYKIAELGFYDPLSKQLNIDKIKLHKYLNCGAYPTDTVRHLLYKVM